METTRAPAVMYAAVCWADCVSAPAPAAPAPDEAKRRAVVDEAARRAKVRRALEESMMIRGGLKERDGEEAGWSEDLAKEQHVLLLLALAQFSSHSF